MLDDKVGAKKIDPSYCLTEGTYRTITPHLLVDITASVAEWLRAWDTMTMFEATVCGRS